MGLSHKTVADVLEHLETQCLALTAREKREKLKETQLPWDHDDDIRTYFTKLDKLEEELKNEYAIDWPTKMKIMQAVNKMYDCCHISKKDMMDWEDKAEADKMWVHCQTYFGDLWEKKQ